MGHCCRHTDAGSISGARTAKRSPAELLGEAAGSGAALAALALRFIGGHSRNDLLTLLRLLSLIAQREGLQELHPNKEEQNRKRKTTIIDKQMNNAHESGAHTAHSQHGVLRRQSERERPRSSLTARRLAQPNSGQNNDETGK